MNLDDLATLLEAYASGTLSLPALQDALAPMLTADPLGAEASDATPWDRAHHDARLFWRLVYLIETELDTGEAPRRVAGRVVAALRGTGSPEVTFELLPLLVDQERLCTIVERHGRGLISRTGFLSVIAESGYPGHVKLWLEHAPVAALQRMCADLARADYARVAAAFERPPAT